MPDPRAFEVRREGALAGFLGEGAGPFVFSSDSSLGYPLLEHARFTSVDDLYESDVGEVLESERSFDACVRRLGEVGFELLPTDYDRVFEPKNRVPVGGPSASEALERSRNS